MTRSLIAVAAALLTAQAAPPRVEPLGWLAGHWSSEVGGRWVEESWSTPRGGVMLGYSRSGRGDTLTEFEFLRVAVVNGAATYLAQPDGRPPTPFRLTEHSTASATFDNPQHDYPQRIRYVRRGDTLIATISAIDGSRPISWTFRRL